MPAWKTFDESTAAALKDQVGATSVTVETISQPLFADGDTVVVAPTLQKGAALVITARKKLTPAKLDEPAQFSPLIEAIAVPEATRDLTVEFAPKPVVSPEEELIERPQPDVTAESEFTFGPTTWERADEPESPVEFNPPEQETRSTDPEIWDLPSHAPPQPLSKSNIREEIPVEANNEWEEERYVATGFLGLEDYVEDEQEILRAKRPWWKRIFSD